MTVEKKSLESLLREVNRIVTHKKEIELIRGEQFNVFSILRMERAENNTHSAFLNELLNPKGSHYMGTKFLELFLQVIGCNTIDVATAYVKTEHSIGRRDDKNRSGGRIDIYIWDINGYSISIENKIEAGDQHAQIERYCNHNKKKNTVFYLTKDGANPSDNSKGTLIAGEDFYLLSYREDIVNWLNLCLKECVNLPILRETIKQYIILIKKITNTMEDKTQKELIDLILTNYEVSSFIASNFDNAKHYLKEKFRCDVFDSLNKELGNQYSIYKGNEAKSTNSQIWIKPNVSKESHLYFGIESFSGENNFNHLIIGIFNAQAPKETPYAAIEGVVSTSKWWLNVREFDDYQNKKIHLSNTETLLLLHTDKEFRAGLIQDIVRQVKEYLVCETEPLVNYINTLKQ